MEIVDETDSNLSLVNREDESRRLKMRFCPVSKSLVGFCVAMEKDKSSRLVAIEGIFQREKSSRRPWA